MIDQWIDHVYCFVISLTTVQSYSLRSPDHVTSCTPVQHLYARILNFGKSVVFWVNLSSISPPFYSPRQLCFMSSFGSIPSPFSSPWLAIIMALSSNVSSLSLLLLLVNSCILFNFFFRFRATLKQNVCYCLHDLFSLKIPQVKDGILPLQTEGAFLVKAWPPRCATPPSPSCVHVHEQYR